MLAEEEKIVLKHRDVEGGRRQFYAIIFCAACGSSCTSGEWRDSMGTAVSQARENRALHLRTWPQCDRAPVPA